MALPLPKKLSSKVGVKRLAAWKEQGFENHLCSGGRFDGACKALLHVGD